MDFNVSGNVLGFGGLILSVVFFGISVWLSVSSSRRLREIKGTATEIDKNVSVLEKFTNRTVDRLHDEVAASRQDLTKTVTEAMQIIVTGSLEKQHGKEWVEKNAEPIREATAQSAVFAPVLGSTGLSYSMDNLVSKQLAEWLEGLRGLREDDIVDKNRDKSARERDKLAKEKAKRQSEEEYLDKHGSDPE